MRAAPHDSNLTSSFARCRRGKRTTPPLNSASLSIVTSTVRPLGATLAMLNHASDSRCSTEINAPTKMVSVMPSTAMAPAIRPGVGLPKAFRHDLSNRGIMLDHCCQEVEPPPHYPTLR